MEKAIRWLDFRVLMEIGLNLTIWSKARLAGQVQTVTT
jgi:hypothetical protein